MRNVFSIQDDDDRGRGPALEDPRDEKPKKKKKEPLTRKDYRKRLQELLQSYENKPLSFAERRIIEGMKSKSLI